MSSGCTRCYHTTCHHTECNHMSCHHTRCHHSRCHHSSCHQWPVNRCQCLRIHTYIHTCTHTYNKQHTHARTHAHTRPNHSWSGAPNRRRIYLPSTDNLWLDYNKTLSKEWTFPQSYQLVECTGSNSLLVLTMISVVQQNNNSYICLHKKYDVVHGKDSLSVTWKHFNFVDQLTREFYCLITWFSVYEFYKVIYALLFGRPL